jgi:hypothetical protein
MQEFFYYGWELGTPGTHPSSPYRHFVIKCQKCHSYKVRFIAEHDEAGESKVVVFCPSCQIREQIRIETCGCT